MMNKKVGIVLGHIVFIGIIALIWLIAVSAVLVAGTVLFRMLAL